MPPASTCESCLTLLLLRLFIAVSLFFWALMPMRAPANLPAILDAQVLVLEIRRDVETLKVLLIA